MSRSARVSAVTVTPRLEQRRDEVLAEHAARPGDQRSGVTGVRTRLQRLPPGAVVAVPGDGRARGPSSNGDRRRVAQLVADLGDVQRVPPVVALAVVDAVAPVPVPARSPSSSTLGELPVGQLGAAADVVDLAGPALLERQLDARGSGRRRAASRGRCRRRRTAAPCWPSMQVGDEQRDDLLRELVGAVVVGAAGDHDVHPVGAVVGQREQVRAGLRGRVGRVGLQRPRPRSRSPRRSSRRPRRSTRARSAPRRAAQGRVEQHLGAEDVGRHERRRRRAIDRSTCDSAAKCTTASWPGMQLRRPGRRRRCRPRRRYSRGSSRRPGRGWPGCRSR